MDKLKKVGKWVGIGLGVLVAAVAVLVGVAWFSWSSHQGARFETPDHDFAIPELTDENREEAERLYLARGCGECHGPDGAGRVLVDIPPFLMAPPNITGVLREMSANDIHKLVRRGIRADGSGIFFMPSHEYARMPDEELGLIVAHVRSLPQSDATQPQSGLRVPGMLLVLFGVVNGDEMIPANLVDQDAPFEPRGEDEIGWYISRGCMGCHGQHFSGGPIPGAPEEATGLPRNLTPHSSGLEGWTLEQFTVAMREGRTPDGGTLNPDFMPYRIYQHLTDEEIAALFEFLQGLEPRELGNR